MPPPDEFAWIDRLKPLTRGDDRALGLEDDAAVIPGRPGFDLVVSKDAVVEGVHFPAGESAEGAAQRLLRTSLSDLAAKAAEPFGYFLMTAWPAGRDWADREAFIRGLATDGEAYGVALLGGDTVGTSGPLTLSATVMGWAPAGRTVLRSGARAGDLLVVCGTIGDGWLGLRAAMGDLDDPSGFLTERYRRPRPLFNLRDTLREWARAAADVSDGLVADAGHIARASRLALTLELKATPRSTAANAWLDVQPNHASALADLATGGDDYAVVCAVDPADEALFHAGARAAGVESATVGAFGVGAGVQVNVGGRLITLKSAGWRH